MRRRQKIIFALVSTVLLTGITLVSAGLIVRRGFARLEAEQNRQTAARAVAAVDDAIKSLHQRTIRWANWDETYTFASDGNPQFIEHYLSDARLADLQLSVLAIVDRAGRVVVVKGAREETRVSVPTPPGFYQWLSAASPLVNLPADRSSSGLVMLPDGPLIVSARPILHSDHSGVPMGTLIFGRFLNKRAMQDLAPFVGAPFELTLAKPVVGSVQPVIVKDVRGVASIALVIQPSPAFHLELIQTLKTLILTTLLTVGMFAVGCFFLHRKLSLGRDAIRNTGLALSELISHDETAALSPLADQINEMITALDEVRQGGALPERAESRPVNFVLK